MAEWGRLAKKARRTLLESHWFSAVLGPRGHHHIVDHHHLCLALLQEGERVLSGMTIRHRPAGPLLLFKHLRRTQRRDAQPGQERQAAAGRAPRRQDAGDGRPSGAGAARRPLRAYRSRASATGQFWPPGSITRCGERSCADFRYERRGVAHLKGLGKGSKMRYVPLHSAASGQLPHPGLPRSKRAPGWKPAAPSSAPAC